MELKIFGKYMLGLTAVAALVCLIDECARRDERQRILKGCEEMYTMAMEEQNKPRENDTAYNDTKDSFKEV